MTGADALCGPGLLQSLAILAGLLFVKHLLADGPLQTQYQLANKGRLLHPGGLLHAGIHVGLSALCLVGWLVVSALPASGSLLGFLGLVLVVEFLVHYCTDLLKVRLDQRFGWSTVEISDEGAPSLRIVSDFFFFSFLTDQTIHSLTYIWMVYAIGSVLTGPAGLLADCPLMGG